MGHLQITSLEQGPMHQEWGMFTKHQFMFLESDPLEKCSATKFKIVSSNKNNFGSYLMSKLPHHHAASSIFCIIALGLPLSLPCHTNRVQHKDTCGDHVCILNHHLSGARPTVHSCCQHVYMAVNYMDFAHPCTLSLTRNDTCRQVSVTI